MGFRSILVELLCPALRIEYMMGHVRLGLLDKSYFKTSILEMAAEYVKAVPNLTIDDPTGSGSPTVPCPRTFSAWRARRIPR